MKKRRTQTQLVSRTELRWVMSLAGGLLALGCDASNPSSGDLPEIERDVVLPGPSRESLDLWAAPGDNLLAALVQIDESDGGRVAPRDNWLLAMA